MESSLVSVIIPCYNHGKFLKEAVDSVLASSYKNVEIIVVNDGSDKDVEFLHSFSAPKTKVIHQEHLGVVQARNNAIRESNGKYILPLDSDDKIHPEYIEKAVRVLENSSEIGIVYCNAEIFCKKNDKWSLSNYKFPNILYKNMIFSTSMFRKCDFENVGGYKSDMEIGCEDWELWISLIEQGLQPYKISEVLFYYRKNENIRSHSATKLFTYIKIRKNIIDLHKNLYKKNMIKIFFPMVFDVVSNIIFCLSIKKIKH